MKTAVEFLESEIQKAVYIAKSNQVKFDELIKQAKLMEKEQIIIAYKADLYPCSDEDAEQYYNETFKQEEQCKNLN